MCRGNCHKVASLPFFEMRNCHNFTEEKMPWGISGTAPFFKIGTQTQQSYFLIAQSSPLNFPTPIRLHNNAYLNANP